VAILKPKIEQIADDEQPGAARFSVLEKIQNSALAERLVLAVGRAEMGVGEKKVCGHCRSDNLGLR
jgi:hypothetical protein